MNQPNHKDVLPAYGQDIFNYLSANTASNHQLHMVVSFEGQLRQDILAKAMRITMDLEPILGCRFVEDAVSPYFKRRTDLDALNHCPVCETENPDTALSNFIAISTDSQKDPFVMARILRTHTKDTLCVKFDHTAGDGGGLKEYVYLLADVYTHLCSHSDYPISQPPPQRDCAYIFKHFGIDDPPKAWQPSQTPPEPVWYFPVTQYKNQAPVFDMRQLKKELFLALRALAKNQGATINDILLTAYYRALFKITATPENQAQPISVSVDLRRFIPSKVVAANVGSSFHSLLSNITGEAFLATLKRVTKVTTKLKQSHIIITSALFFEFLGSQKFLEAKKFYENLSLQNRKTNIMPPFFSNIGVIKPLCFGDLSAKESYIVTPAMYAPLFMLGASTYNEVLTLIANYHTSDISQELMNNFLSFIMEELEGVSVS